MSTEARPRRRWRDGVAESATPNIGRAAQLAAREIGCQPKTAAHHIAEAKHIAAAIVRAYRQVGDLEGLERFLRPIREAEQGQAQGRTEDLIASEQTVDGREDECEVAYLQHPGPVTADTWARQLRKLIALCTPLAEALEAEARA